MAKMDGKVKIDEEMDNKKEGDGDKTEDVSDFLGMTWRRN